MMLGTVYGFVSLCCKACKVEMAQSQADYEAMQNGTELLSIYTENDIRSEERRVGKECM